MPRVSQFWDSCRCPFWSQHKFYLFDPTSTALLAGFGVYLCSSWGQDLAGMGGSQSRVEQHDATLIESEQGSGAVKPSDELLAGLAEQQRKHSSSWNQERRVEPRENNLHEEGHREREEAARAVLQHQVPPCSMR